MLGRLTAGARLTDTERRTWKSKTGKVPMGHAPLVTFKILYRHERKPYQHLLGIMFSCLIQKHFDTQA